ncbi:MAG: hypothetical protein RR619_03155, partial [Raoultibacter sp.]
MSSGTPKKVGQIVKAWVNENEPRANGLFHDGDNECSCRFSEWDQGGLPPCGFDIPGDCRIGYIVCCDTCVHSTHCGSYGNETRSCNWLYDDTEGTPSFPEAFRVSTNLE